MTSKTNKLLTSAAVLAAVAGTGATVSAEETTQPTQPVLGTENTATTETAETLKPQVDAAAQKVDEKAAAVAEAEIDLEIYQNTYDAEKAFVDQTDEAIKALEETAQQATPENIAAAESVVEDAEQDVKVAEEKQATAEAKVAPAKEAVELAESVVTDAETDEATAKVEVETAQDTVTALENNEDPRIELEKRVETAKEDVEITEDNLTKVTTDGEAKTAELEAVVNTEAEKVKAAKTGKKVIAERAVGDIIERSNAETKKSSPVKYSGAETVSIELTDAQKEEYARTGRIAFTSDANELTKWAIYYMHKLRDLNGITERVEATDEAVRYAVARADEMRRNGKMSHSSTLWDEGKFKNSDVAENIAYSSHMDSLSDQELAYYLVARWYDDSYNVGSGIGHREMILFTSEGLGVAVNGVQGSDYYAAMDTYFDESTTYEYTSTVARKYNYKEVQDANGEWYSTINGEETVFLPKLTFVYLTDATTDVDESALKAAKSALDAHKVNLAEAVRKAEAQLAEAHAELTAATEALEAAPKSEDRAQALADAKAVLAEKQAKYETAKQETVDAKADLETAKAELSRKEAAVAETVNAVEDAKSALVKAQGALKALQNPEAQLEELNEQRWNALMNMNSFEFSVANAVERLDALRKEHAEAEEAYHLVKARYDALLALSDKLGNDIDAPKDDKQPETPETDNNKSDQDNSDTGSEMKPVTDTGSEVKPVTDTGSEMKPVTDTGSEMKPVTDTGSEMKPVTDTGSEVKPVTDTGSEVKPVTDTGSEVKPVTDTGSEVKPVTDTGSEVKPVTGTGSEVKPVTDTGSEVKPVTDTGSETKPVTGTGSETKPVTGTGSANSSKDAEVEMQSNGYRKSPVTAVSYGKVNVKSAVEMIASKTDDKKTYSRVAKAEILPETGSNESVMAMLIGMAITGLGLVSFKKRDN